ncbi:YgaP family membrane protein [Thalassobacillus hwangdonensis]|uniref:DUF2892 domain-containing protein n=1 Tax=Thalassobacillus hwangdonensis TaxID=546108 RepID=A0ABW3L4X0_9BACI
MKPNIGIMNAMLRITVGLTMISFFSILALKKPNRSPNLWVIGVASMKVAEGILRYCPLTAIFNAASGRTQGQQGQQDQGQQQNGQTYNPS